MPLSKSQKRANEIIQKEQKQLLRIQKELDEIVTKINDSINVLKVEELQLKASAVVSKKPASDERQMNEVSGISNSTLSTLNAFNNKPTKSTDWIHPTSMITETAINLQAVDLAMNNLPYQQDIEEDDE